MKKKIKIKNRFIIIIDNRNSDQNNEINRSFYDKLVKLPETIIYMHLK